MRSLNNFFQNSLRLENISYNNRKHKPKMNTLLFQNEDKFHTWFNINNIKIAKESN